MIGLPDYQAMHFLLNRFGSWILAMLLLVGACPSWATPSAPNFVVILVDDAALMDFGGFGGEAHTPHINKLADRGVRFSNYRTSPMCAPSRAMLLTGMDSHRTGVGTLPELISDEQKGSDAYALHLLPEVQTVADRLKRDGYQTFMTGKWHLGQSVEHLPHRHGFDRSYVLAASGADNWDDKPFIPFYADAPWYEDDKSVGLPDDFYSSQFLIDRMISYLEERDPDQPFFSYVAFQAIHIPVQTPSEFTKNYEGVYQDGWDALRQKRFERAKRLGLVPEGSKPPIIPSSLRSWTSLSDVERLHYERSMMVNAGMLEAMDHHIGRLMNYLDAAGQLENTVFIITSDNGPESADPTRSLSFRLWMGQNGYHRNADSYGEKGYMGAIGAEWASAAASPNSLFKMYASEGGTRVPLIISGPGVKSRSFNGALAFVTDITPTVLELAGSDNKPGPPMDGRSLVPVLQDRAAEVYGPDDAVGMELGGNGFVIRGDYKLTRNSRPRGDGRWRLHHIVDDPAERVDLSATMPELRKSLLKDYGEYAARNGVVKLPDDFDVVAQVNSNIQKTLIKRNAIWILVIFVAFSLLLLMAFRLLHRMRRAPS